MSNLEPLSAAMTSTGLFLAHVRENIKGRVLDVGCGHKPYKAMFDVDEWVGLDIRPVGEIVGDAHQMPVEDASFDTVLCTGLLHYCMVPMQVISECARVLKPGGSLVLSTPMTYPDEEGVFYTFHPNAVQFLLQSTGLAPQFIMRDGRLMHAEWAALNGFDKYQLPIPVNVGSWVDSMDKRYPAIVGAVAKKE